MPKFRVTQWRQIKFSKTFEVEAADEDAAEEAAEEMSEDEDTNDTLEWEADAWERYGQSDIEEIGEEGHLDAEF